MNYFGIIVDFTQKLDMCVFFPVKKHFRHLAKSMNKKTKFPFLYHQKF